MTYLSDPNDVLARLRSHYKRWTESDPHSDEEWYAATDLANQFDELDRHLSGGGQLPADWDVTPEPSELDERVHDLLEAGYKIRAIKLVREETGMGLNDAKLYVDNLAANPR